MKCPQCGGSSWVRDTGHRVGGTIRRRRVCHAKGHHFTTLEPPDGREAVEKKAEPVARGK